MKVFIAGATGAIGKPLVKKLLAAGHEVFGMTRSNEKAESLIKQGAKPILADAFNIEEVNSFMQGIKPDVVIEQLTSLPKEYSAETMQATDAINTKVRLVGGANIHSAAQTTGVKRYIIQSSGFFYPPGNGLADESEPFVSDAPEFTLAAARTFEKIEKRVLSSNMDGIALRYGFFYGPGTWYDKGKSIANLVKQQAMPIIGSGQGVWSFIHIEDAADATIAAIVNGKAGKAYNIVDDNPSEVNIWLPAYSNWLGAPPPIHIKEKDVGDPNFIYYGTKLRGANNIKAKEQLEWNPKPLEWL
ncbi:MAG: NAD(P)-dependent oxidoreductase [Thermodesulfobacteriota bacterium]